MIVHRRRGPHIARPARYPGSVSCNREGTPTKDIKSLRNRSNLFTTEDLNAGFSAVIVCLVTGLSPNIMFKTQNTKPLDPDSCCPSERKAFVPLENDPVLMTALAHRLGLPPKLAFHDVFSIEDPDLLAMTPRPALALLLVFPISKTYENFKLNEDQELPHCDNVGAQDSIIWFKQTIRNACGIMAILHAVCNGSTRKLVAPGSHLENLINEAIPLTKEQRANLIHKIGALEDANQDAACQGQSKVPSAEDEIDLHYVCFVKGEDHKLWEMDGRRNGPLDRGTLDVEEDVLSEKALDLSVRSFLKREEEAGNGEMRFSLIALAPSEI